MEISACPLCKTENQRLIHNTHEGFWYVRCFGCRAVGRNAPNAETAIAEWNYEAEKLRIFLTGGQNEEHNRTD